MKIAILGASTGLGRALADGAADAGHDLFLLSSDLRDLDPLCADLRLRHGVSVHATAMDLTNFYPSELRRRIHEAFGALNTMIYVAGAFSDEDVGPIPDMLAERLISVNFSAGVRAVNIMLPDLEQMHGNLVGIGSVAAIRPRGRSCIYSAAKRGLEFYFEALRHRYAGGPVRVRFIRVGYMETSMTFGKRLFLPVISTERAAASVLNRMQRSGPVAYVPEWWRPIAWVLRSLPWPIYKRLQF